jgi:hypothetical protein
MRARSSVALNGLVVVVGTEIGRRTTLSTSSSAESMMTRTGGRPAWSRRRSRT